LIAVASSQTLNQADLLYESEVIVTAHRISPSYRISELSHDQSSVKMDVRLTGEANKRHLDIRFGIIEIVSKFDYLEAGTQLIEQVPIGSFGQ